jgi:hypothetical protein
MQKEPEKPSKRPLNARDRSGSTGAQLDFDYTTMLMVVMIIMIIIKVNKMILIIMTNKIPNLNPKVNLL